MADYGSILERRLQRVYREAQKDLEKKLAEFVEKFEKKDQQKREKLEKGEITEQEYKDWRMGQVFSQNQWKAKIEEVTTILFNSNLKAMTIIRDEQMNVFAENANRQAYEVETVIGYNPEGKKDIRMGGINFDIYDVATVDRLIEEKPELLPRSRLKERKDKAWNQGIIANVVTQGIIQGESIPQIANRMARDTASKDMKAMVRYARTAMTGAQNAGRLETMHRAQAMGIRSQKKWLATLDTRTRDSHRHLDGQVRELDDPFISELGRIMFPGDPKADPGDIYNCRCTLEYEYPDYPNAISERAAYDEYIDRDGKSHRDYFVMPANSGYGDWLKAKKERQLARESSPVIINEPMYNLSTHYSDEQEESIMNGYDRVRGECPLQHDRISYIGDFRKPLGIPEDMDYEDFLDAHPEYKGVGAEYFPPNTTKFSKDPFIVVYQPDFTAGTIEEYLDALVELRERMGWNGSSDSFYNMVGNTETMIAHEYAHAIAHDAGLYFGQKNYSRLEAIFKKYTSLEIGRDLSLYAATNPEEMLAEAFVASHNERLTTPIVREIMELIKECRGE